MNRLCGICEKLVETHYPGISYIKVNGNQLVHPKCWASETGETEDDRNDLMMQRLKRSVARTNTENSAA